MQNGGVNDLLSDLETKETMKFAVGEWMQVSGASITMKIGFANGLNQLVFVVYRHLISTILFCPFAFVFER
ncbi:hypothetical protein L2E82_17371 [Cichorium intybus]|uniref:Uncharacterized protein n=1 Tax=Cichorium intybus TaxID=13427 RepID=A0ACB9F8S4_CICIN|nr:hypothetical protein L2E82_17371 [Cichorium intybus]